MNYLLGTPAYRPKAFDGSYLSEGRLVRFIYLDEGGTSAQEPVTVVAGVIVNADTEWDKLEAAIESLKPRVPEQIRKGFVFHATHIFSGSQKGPAGTKWKDFWPLDDRLSLLEDFVAIPRKYLVGIAIGFMYRSGRKPPGLEPKDVPGYDHVFAFANCVIAGAEFLADQAPGENAIIVVENHNEMRQSLRKVPAFLRSSHAPPEMVGNAPLSRIKDVPHFCLKEEAVMLQLADACAFVVRGFLSNHPKVKPLYRAFRGNSVHFMDSASSAKSGRSYLSWKKLHP